MRTRRLLVTLALALLLASPAALAQADASLEAEARSGDQPLEQATPVEPGDTITVLANATTPDDDREWRLTVTASIDGGANETSEDRWNGSDDVQVATELTAPEEEGPHALEWTALLEARADDGDDWVEQARSEDREGFEVRQRDPPPQAEDVRIEVRTADGGSIDELGNLTPGEQVTLHGDVELPERNRTDWNVTMSAFIDDDRVGHAQQTRAGAGELSFPLQFAAPSGEGSYELRWEIQVQYRDSNEEAWTDLTTEEDTASFGVQPLQVPEGPGIPWLWILIVGAVLVGGGAGAYYMFRPPKQIKGEPRSQAMKDLEGGGATATVQEPEEHPQVKILEARAEDIRRMIELARQRHEQGEITEHQFDQIRQNKEAELEQVEAEIEDYRQRGGSAAS